MKAEVPLKIAVPLIGFLGLLSIALFFSGLYYGGGAAVLTLVVFSYIFILLPRLPIPEITKQDVMVIVMVVLLPALLFTINFSYDKMAEWSGMKSAAWALLAIAMRPVGKFGIEALLDQIFRNTRQKMLEKITDKSVQQAPELRQFARCGTLAEGLYSAIVTGFALLNVLPAMFSNTTEQQLLILAAMIISSHVVFWLHPDQRTLRRYLSKER